MCGTTEGDGGNAHEICIGRSYESASDAVAEPTSTDGYARRPLISRYDLKKAALWPHTVYKRRASRHLDHASRSMLEVQYYRPTMYSFIAAVAEKPDLLVDADLGPDSVVLDVGAYVGDWSEQISERYGSHIHAFEPAPASIERFRERLGDAPNVELHPYGLGAADARVPLALEGPGSTVREARGTFGSTVVELRDISGVLDELGAGEIDLCKINIEGAEFDVLDRCITTGWLPRIRLLSVQFHEWHPKAYARRTAIRRALRRTHEEVWNYPFVWELWKRKAR
jgi:FkbM family methyltransferase